MKNALIVSLNFRVAHVAHLVASYLQMENLGYRSVLYIHHDLIPFLPKGIRYITDLAVISRVDIAIFWFPASKNTMLMSQLKIKYQSKIIYVFHEPIEKYSTYKGLGLSNMAVAKIYVKYLYSISFLLLSDGIIVPSKKAMELYQNSVCKFANRNVQYLPLLFNDEAINQNLDREYFSYIGTVAKDHAFDEFLKCIIALSENQAIPSHLKFLIATKNNLIHTKEIDELLDSGRLKIIEGKPLTDEEINQCYAKSYIVWNAYNRTTQSGVLAKASMFGTPALVKKDNLSEFSIDGYNVKAVSSNTDIDELATGIKEVLNNFTDYSKNSRQIFESLFDYKVHNKTMEKFISQL